MGLFDTFRGDSNEYDHYRVCRSSEGDTSGAWVPVGGWKKLDEPPEKDEFELNTEELEPGIYKPYGVIDGMNRKLPTELRWTVKIKENDDEDEAAAASGSQRELKQLRQEVRQLANQGQEQNEDPEDMMKAIRAKLMASAVSNEQFMARHGDQVFSWVFEEADANGDGEGPGYEEWKESPYAAIAYDLSNTAMNEPHKLRELGENLGGGAGSFLDGFAEGAADHEAVGAQPEDESEEDNDSPATEIDSGPTTLDDLGAAVDNEADELATELNETMQQASEPAETAESPSADMEDAQATIDETPDQAGAVPEEATMSEVSASPEVAEKIEERDDDGLDPDRCQHVKPNGEQCGNPQEEGSKSCWIEDHGPADPDADHAPDPNEDTAAESPADPSNDDEPTEEEVANAL